jgi:hypothetical protein
MTGEAEAAGDVLTGAIVGGTIESASGKQGPAAHGGKCLNCGATVDGAFCASCGQRAHLHRSLVHLGHDILHGVFHFEGKMWRTLPELFFHPGRLTRRYIDGERAKFVSPMALYLFTVFLMFGVISFTASNMFNTAEDSIAGDFIDQWKEGNEAAKERTDEKVDAVRDRLKEEDLAPAKRAELEKELSDLQSKQAVMDALAKGDWVALQKLGTTEQARQAIEEAKAAAAKTEAKRGRPKEQDLSADKRAELEQKLSDLQTGQAVMDALAKGDWAALQNLEANEKTKEARADAEQKASKTASSGIKVNGGKVDVGWPALQARLEHGVKELKDNPALALYKMKIAGYKYSWALIPLSVPLMWLLFFWRRDIHLYDHAIFVTYSISFMMMFLTALSLATAFGVSNAIWGTIGIVPPLHLYKQLRYAYNLSRFGALLRLWLLSIGVFIVLTIFFMLLLLIGMIG